MDNEYKNKNTSKIKTAVFFLVIGSAIAYLSMIVYKNFIIFSASPREAAPKEHLCDDEQRTIAVFEQTSPSVVYIATSQRVRDFWNRNVFSVPKGAGSGFVWDAHGHIVTNFHVIEGASEATVWLNNGQSYKASLVGASPEHDLAVLKIFVAFNSPPPLKIGSSHDLKVGQKVFAIGNPFGLDYTLTSGIVSALNRTLDLEGGLAIEHLIQTDAAINPGNSGGPLLDSSGRLIGITTAIYSPSGAYAGIGFAVPVDTINRVVPSIISSGKYIRPSIGIIVDEALNNLITEKFGMEGVAVLDVQKDSPAFHAGIVGSRIDRNDHVVLGDVIVSVDGKKVRSLSNLFALLDEYQVGDKVTLEIIRNQNTIKVEIILAQ